MLAILAHQSIGDMMLTPVVLEPDQGDAWLRRKVGNSEKKCRVHIWGQEVIECPYGKKYNMAHESKF